ncbi:hypothetical protein O181_069894 [Austropuccinia psidii MF-1]|uniref:Uncharacterized protein n=1 Tax=Austropuccinia psidii MF-1 TaxID=1389203 RepID=A0A9Q3F066_9BASI|nr:hypothetical protein [Austropuccinia psidii MF-1]
MSYFDLYTTEQILSQFLPCKPLRTDASGSLRPPKFLRPEMNPIHHYSSLHRSKHPWRYHPNSSQGSLNSGVTTTPSLSHSLVLTGPDIINKVEDEEAVQESGATDSSTDELVAQSKDSPDKSARSSVYNYFKVNHSLVTCISTF